MGSSSHRLPNYGGGTGIRRGGENPRLKTPMWKVPEMRKSLALLISAGLAVGMLAGPSAAAKKKKIEDTVSLTAAPFPNLSSATGTPTPGCTAGEEGVHKITTPLHVPGAGKLTADLAFTGDWDLYVFDKKGLVIGSSAQDQTAGAPMEEALSLKFKKMSDIAIVACNWAGAPQAELHYKLLYTASKSHHH
jgi:hypothetical protein